MTVLIYVNTSKQVGDPDPQGLRECRRRYDDSDSREQLAFAVNHGRQMLEDLRQRYYGWKQD